MSTEEAAERLEKAAPEGADATDLVYVDELTNLFNRRYINVQIRALIEEAATGDEPLSLVMIDVDKFKNFNDTYGHQFGDKVLVQVASVMKKCVRDGDIAIRYAGDEFMLVLPGITAAVGRKICELVADFLKNERFKAGGVHENVSVTLSMGISQLPEDGTDLDSLVEQADRALYFSKHKGRDCISLPVDIPPDMISDSERFKVFPAREMVGRGEESLYFTDKLGQALLGKAGFILYEGVPGIGKTRLLDEFVNIAQRDRVLTLFDTCQEAKTGQPFGVLVKILDKFLMESEEDLGRFLLNLSDVELGVVAAQIPELALAENLPEAPSEDELSNQDRRFHLYNGLKRLVENVITEQPTAMILDDIHWLDEATLTLLGAVIREQKQARFCVAGMYNAADSMQLPQPLHRLLTEGDGLGEVDRRTLEPFTVSETGQLLGQIFKGFDKAEKFIHFVHKRTGGNPFFIEEMLKFMLRKGMIHREDYKWKIKPVSPEDIPADVTSLIEKRMESLHEEARNVSKDASVIGQTIDLETLKGVANMNESTLLEFLEKAKKENLLSLENMDKGNFDIRFNTPTMRDIIYKTIPDERRKDLHKRVGEFLEKSSGGDLSRVIWALSYHFKRTEALQKADEYAKVAARQASQLFSAEEAESYAAEEEEEEGELIGDPLSESDVVKFGELLRSLRVTLQRVSIYTSSHKVAISAIDGLFDQITDLLQRVNVLTISDIEGHIIVNRQELEGHTIENTSEENLIGLMREHGLRSLTLIQGLKKEEFTLLLNSLAEKQDMPVGEIMKKHRVRSVRMNKTKYIEEGASRSQRVGKSIPPPVSETDGGEGRDQARPDLPAAYGHDGRDVPVDMDPEAIARFLTSIMDMDGLQSGLSEIADGLDAEGSEFDPAAVRAAVAEQMLDRDPEQIAQILSMHEDPSMERLDLLGSLEALLEGPEGEDFAKRLAAALTTLRVLSGGEDGETEGGASVIQDLLDRIRSGAGAGQALPAPVEGEPVLEDGELSTGSESEAQVPVPRDERLDDYMQKLSTGRPIRWSPELKDDLADLVNSLAGEGRNEQVQALTRIVIHYSKSPSREVKTQAVEAVDTLLKEMRFPGCDDLRAGLMEDLLGLLQEEDLMENVKAISGIFEHQVPVLVHRGRYEALSKIVHVLAAKYGAGTSAPVEKREAAEAILEAVGRDDVLEVLLSDIQSGDPERQQYAMHLLIDLGKKAIEPLVEIVKASQDLRVRKASVSILKEIGPAAFQRALEELTIETHPPALKNLIHVCEAFGDREEPIEHMTHLLSHTSKLVKLEALRAFGRMKNDTSRRILTEQVQSQDADLQKTAVHLIGLYRYHEAADALISLLNDRRAFVGEGGEELQRVLCITLGKLKSELAVSSLEEIVKPKKALFGKRDAPESVRAAVVWALGEIGSRRSLEIVKGLGEGAGPTEREAISLVLSRESAS
ncbi:diguanylate cyclase domain-containing protein [Thermodesulfobacteriota bacterium]